MSGFAQASNGYVISGETPARIPALTGIRGIAAVWVVLFHLLAVANVGNLSYLSGIPLLRSGYLAVDMFFILSGYVLALTYGHSLQRPSLVTLRDFWIGRAFRILPLHWAALSFCLALYLLFDGELVMTQRHDALSFVASALLIQNWLFMPKVWNLPTWSLSAEWLAYILLPIIVMGAQRIRSVAHAILAVLLLWMVLAIACLAAGDMTLDHIRSLGLIRCLIEFSIGVVMYRIRVIAKLNVRYGNVLFLCGAATLVIATISPVLDLLAVPAFSLIVLAAGRGSSYTQKLLGNPIAMVLGEISFSAYLLHWLIVELAAYSILKLHVTGSGSAWVLGLAFLSVWPAAWLSWRHIEVPFQKYGKEVLRRVRARDLVSTQAVDAIRLAPPV